MGVQGAWRAVQRMAWQGAGIWRRALQWLNARRLELQEDAVGGSVILVAIAAPAVIGGLALSIDIGIWYLEKRKLQQISDAASLGAVRVLKNGGSMSDVSNAALSDAKKNGFVPGPDSTFVVNTPPKLGPYAGNSAAVEVIVTRKLPLFFSSFFIGSGSIVSARSVAAESQVQNRHLEVALMLDVSASMAQRSEVPGMLRLAGMQQAAKGLIDAVIQSSQEPFSSRVALIPYSSSVNVGETYFSQVTNRAYAGGSTNVVERAGAPGFTEDAPEPGKYFPAYISLRSGGLTSSTLENHGLNPRYSKISPLSSNKDELKAVIDDFKPSGTTAGHLGIAWSWYVMSPKWAQVWSKESAPQGYDSDKTMKIAVLMSDFDMNTSYQLSNGDSQAQAEMLCKRLKDGGITVYTVGYNVPMWNPRAVALWKGCASAPDKVYSTRTIAGLIAAFQTIARTAVGSVSTGGTGLVE